MRGGTRRKTTLFILNLPSAASRANKRQQIIPHASWGKFLLSAPWSAHVKGPIGGVIDWGLANLSSLGIFVTSTLSLTLSQDPYVVVIYKGKPYTPLDASRGGISDDI